MQNEVKQDQIFYLFYNFHHALVSFLVEVKGISLFPVVLPPCCYCYDYPELPIEFLWFTLPPKLDVPAAYPVPLVALFLSNFFSYLSTSFPKSKSSFRYFSSSS